MRTLVHLSIKRLNLHKDTSCSSIGDTGIATVTGCEPWVLNDFAFRESSLQPKQARCPTSGMCVFCCLRVWPAQLSLDDTWFWALSPACLSLMHFHAIVMKSFSLLGTLGLRV
jgi:hypothetical protein